MLACSQISCGHKVPVDNTVNAANFNNTVLQLKGYVQVLFYNEQYWQSQDMEKRFDYFSQKYRRKMRSFKFHWDVNADGSQYGLEMLPTVVLYYDGLELDRIKGIPESEKDRMSWNKDIELWLLKNVLEKKGNEFTSDYVYRFNNSPRLQMSNY
jgi:hypothetical protein